MNFQDFKDLYCKQTPIYQLQENIQGWNSESLALKTAIHRTNPKTIVEVGSWLGASAIYMSTLTKSSIICVDTFLGSNEILWREKNVKNLVNNFQEVYIQFCSNITSKKLNQQISPLPMTSSSASELFVKENVSVDMVYLDAGHRFREVYADLQDWWPLTKKVLVGDDYSQAWPEVIQAVTQFVQENNLQHQIMDDQFLIFR